jgi:predicted nucleic acid-binding protein
MSFGVDVNILLYASDGSSPLHEKAKAFLERCANGARCSASRGSQS